MKFKDIYMNTVTKIWECWLDSLIWVYLFKKKIKNVWSLKVLLALQKERLIYAPGYV